VVVAPARDAVATYAGAVVAGEILAGNLVKQACARHLLDLEEGESRGLRWNAREAERAIAFFGYLRQSKGKWANQPLSLQAWQQFCIGSTFGWQKWSEAHQRWIRRFKYSLVEIARKNGKTTIGAGVGLYLLDFDGEAGAEVYAAATKRDQARICWGEAASMVRKTPELARRVKEVPSRSNLHVIETASKFEALGADSDTTDGLNPHGAIIDELHAHKDRKLVDVLETGVGAREQPLFFYITTAGVAGESIYQEIHDYASRVAEGAVQDDAWFVYIATLDKDDDWTEPRNYIKGNPGLGVTVQLDELIAERDRAVEVPGRQNAFKRLRLNVQTEQVDRWLDIATWDAAKAPRSLDEFRGRDCYAGLDLATTTDVAALQLLFPEPDGSFYSMPMFFVPRENIQRRSERDRVPYPQWEREGWLVATAGAVTDYDVIRERILELADDYGLNIKELAYDRWNASQLIVQLAGDGLTTTPVGQGYATMSAPTKELEKLLLEGKLKHDGNALMRWMVANVAVEQDPAGNLKPSKKASTERIDGVVALIMALSRAMLSEDSGGWVLM
jgi:phage terminase large subunit-like protein